MGEKMSQPLSLYVSIDERRLEFFFFIPLSELLELTSTAVSHL